MTTAISAIRGTTELKEYLQAQGLNLILYQKVLVFTSLNWFFLIPNLKMFLQVTIKSII